LHKSLHLVTSGKQPLAEVVSIMKQAGDRGIDFLHIREKHLPADELVQWVSELADYFPRERMIVNDRVDVAVACGLAGAHLAYHSLAPSLAKQVLLDGQLAGRSTHSLEEAEQARRQGADYIFFGHVYESGSKPGLAPRGVQAAAVIASRVQLPVIAIGGIQPRHVPEILAAGCAGIAVISGITSSANPKESVRAYREALDKEELL